MENMDQPFALYQKIKQSVVRDIESGKLKPNDKVPSETQLARQFNASRMTANRALKELTEEHRILRIQGVGTFVARPKPEVALLEIKSIAEEIEGWGGVHSSKVLLLQKESLTKEMAGKLDLASDTVQLADLARSVRDMLSDQADKRGNTIKVNVDPSLPEHVVGDEVRLRQILINLVGNALKFTENGSVDIELKSVKEQEKDIVVFEVHDTGIGIPQELQKKIFEPFYRLDQSRNKESGNYGLGLSIAKRIALWHKGTVSVSSSPMLGARFTIQLPII